MSAEPICPPTGPKLLGARDPDDLAAQLAAVAPGVRVVATDRAFQNKTIASLLHQTPVVSYVGRSGGACFPVSPHYYMSWSMASSFEVGPWRRRRRVGYGVFHVDLPQEESWLWNLDGAHVLGLSVDATRFDAYRAESGAAPRFVEPETRLFSMRSPGGRALAEVLAKVRRELVRPGTVCPTPLSACELEDELIRMVARACLPESPDGPALGQEAARRAEEVLATDLSSPMSLLEAAEQAEVTPRTFSRIIQQRHSVGPMQFRRRRRLEAAFRDLLAGEPAETSVTEVALRYGFNHLGRFSKQYARTFGESPSETLYR